MSELDDAVRKGNLKVDGKVVLKSQPPIASANDANYIGVEVNVSKAAVEPVWYLPGVAQRFEMSVFFMRILRATGVRVLTMMI